MARLPGKPCEGGTMIVSIPRPWSWRVKLGCLLIRLAAWVIGSGYKEEPDA